LIVLNHSGSIQETKNLATQLRPQLEAQLLPQKIEAIQQQAGEKTYTSLAEELLRQTGNT
jgi:signal transduction histidine kinase